VRFAGIGAKRDGTGNTTLTSGLLEFHRILQRLGETHKEGSPAVALPEPAAAPPVAARPDAAKVARAAKAGAAKVPPSTAAAGGPPSEKAMLKAMRVAARRVGGEASRKAAKKVAKKRSREEAAGLGSAKRMRGAGGVDATVLEAAARVRQSYRRAIRTKNIRGYSKHDMGAILLDARGAFRAPTAVERATSNAATKLGEGLDSHSAAAAAAVLKRHGPR